MEDIIVIVVLYGTDVNSSLTLKSLDAIYDNTSKLDVLIYDNNLHSNDWNENKFGNWNVIYIHDGRNLGLSFAYNVGLQEAIKRQKRWILLLDQDTMLTKGYLSELLDVLHNNTLDKVGAVVPQLVWKGKRLSPVLNRSKQNVWWFQKRITSPGCYDGYITAFNSGTLASVDFLTSIGGFSVKYPLDRLDYWYFGQIYENGLSTYVLDAKLEHDLSVLDYNRNMTVQRYQSILASELLFVQDVGKESAFLYKMRLLARFVKQLLLVRDKRYACNTFQQLWK